MPFDLLAFVIILVVLFALIMYFGKSVGIAGIFAIFPSLLIYEKLIYLDLIFKFAKSDTAILTTKVAIFTILMILSFIIARRAVSVVFSWTPVVKFIEAMIISFILTGLLFCSYISITGLSTFIQTYPLNYLLIAAPSFFCWLFAGFFSLIFILRK